MLVVADCETNGLKNPDRLWIIVCREVESGKVHTFLGLTKTPNPFSNTLAKSLVGLVTTSSPLIFVSSTV
jgi:hypothetical protein